ncbi:MAG: ferrous iron transporter B [Firmicutes bacterium]|jgi:ferrous iron transport protein B|nr:ferrous iron transporter B [Bacillota bacterium]MDH7496349.1 nucleoside recognition domain-containing protein [Bacillota bacterium]
MSKRAIALLLLSDDKDVHALVRRTEGGERHDRIRRIVESTARLADMPLSYLIGLERQERADLIARRVTTEGSRRVGYAAQALDFVTLFPPTAIPLLLVVLYLGLYRLVGVFGAGTLVDFLERCVFGEVVNPFVNALVARHVGNAALRELLAGDYGLITLGLRYSVAIVLPVVGTFFLVFSILEDTGYLPRIALMVDRAFKLIGLSGRAVIPITLGFGCGTMATMVTRTLETRRERTVATLLLALAVPCSAQLGVTLGMLSTRPRAVLLWVGVVGTVFLVAGGAASRFLPGERPVFYMEVPPLRVPVVSNVLAKTFARMRWYFAEVMPLFLGASLVIWVGRMTGLFQLVLKGLEVPVTLIGLPPEAAFSFLFGFLRRDYGAAGLYDLARSGKLTDQQLVVASVALTLFVPCVAQFAMMWKERGWRTALAITALALAVAFGTGYLLNLVLTEIGAVV